MALGSYINSSLAQIKKKASGEIRVLFCKRKE